MPANSADLPPLGVAAGLPARPRLLASAPLSFDVLQVNRKTCGQNTANGRNGVFQSIGRKRRTIDAVIGKVIRLFINVDRRFYCIYEAPVIESGPKISGGS